MSVGCPAEWGGRASYSICTLRCSGRPASFGASATTEEGRSVKLYRLEDFHLVIGIGSILTSCR
ncbi:hypothetical protein GCM10023166_13480 [Paeniglutamicibacter cryotolerans]|uniref:Uncharacterized protein n=1 Tax=Paeniglutamicibacter cryotolerans TaxID=670079 RepID=A0A839QHV9_9MICC|nr:hypothetical protein [Paeniglutamicibacter cryotolerans]